MSHSEQPANPPNLFSYATSELSQDAFLAYLLSWSNPEAKQFDPAMHQAGNQFLRLLLASEKPASLEPSKLEVRVQVKNIDVLVYMKLKDASEIVLAVEDKIHAGSYNDLPKYLAAARSEYSGVDDVRGIYLRTGNQADYRDIERNKFRVVDRKMLLQYLQAEETGNPENIIFQNYRAYLEGYQQRLDAFETLPPTSLGW